MKKLLAILLSALLLLPLGFTLHTDSASAEAEEDIWAQIERYENDRLAARGVNVTTASADDYMSMTDGIVALVEAHESYAPGTLFLNGQSVFWHDTNGMGNGWVPNARQKQRANLTGKTPEEAASVETVSYASKGGSPNSSDVALFGPYYGSDSSFTNQYRNEANSIAQASGGVYRLYSGTAATIDAIAHELETSGIVIFDSHGDTDYASGSDYTSRANTSYLCLTSYEGLTNQDTATVQGTFGSYQHAFRSGNGAFVDGTAIANHMDGVAPNSLLWMAICLGMATDGMEAPLRAQGVEVVYGYSQSVSFTGDYKYEEYFWTKMKGGSEVQEAIAYMKNKVGVKDPYTNPPAYPIVVSSEDVYPGHGNVDAVQTVNSTWKLFADYTVTAVSNNTSYGTVSVSGTQITATPAAGYYVAGYQVISGTATATIDGNIINVTPTSDCTIKIIFAQKPTYTVSYQSLGASEGSVTAQIYDVINLPASVSSSVPDGWTFSGWTPAEVEETTTAPVFYRPGAAYTVTGNVTLYALFTRTEGTGNLIYRLVNDNLSDWSGNYIITCGKDTSALVLKGLSGNTSYESASAGGSVTFSNTGMTLNGEVIRNANNAYVFAIASSGAKYTIRNASTGTYMGSYDDYLYSRSSYESSYCNWGVEYDLSNICMKVSNDASSSYPYLVKGSNSYFIVNSTYTTNKTLFWKEELEGVVYYHTSPTATTSPTPTPTPTPTPAANESQYVLVETAPSDWSGQYLIVYKDGPYAMDGSLTTLDVASNYKTVDLSDKTITVNEDEDIFYFTIAKDGNNYSLQSASGYYIGRTNNTNGLNSNTNTKYTVSLSINEEQQANIVGSGGAYLRFNKNNGEKRFRFFRSSTYTNQQPVYLYKYVKPEPRFVTQNLILSGEIGVQFFVDVSMLSDPSTAYMTFTIDDKAGKDGETLKVTTVPYTDAEGAANKLGFKFFVNAIQMADTITATLHYGDGQTIEKTYSVEQYIRDFEDNKAQYDNKTITLVEALCSYGYHVQQFLSAVNHWTLDTDYKAVYQSFNEAYDVNAVKTTAAYNYRMTAETTGAFKAPGMSLVLDSETAIRIFLAHTDGSKLKEEDVTVNVDVPEGSDVDMDEITWTATQKGNRVMVEINGIKAAWLAETFTITAEEYDTDNTQTITVCALSYIDRLLGSEAYAGNTFAQNAVCALYYYAMAAADYNN